MLVSTIFIIRPPWFPFAQPSIDDDSKRFGAQVMELVPALPHGCDQAGRLENVEVLRNSLPGGADLVLHCQTCAQLEERLVVALRQLVKDGAPDRRCNGFENIAHWFHNGQVRACITTPCCP